MIVTCEKCHAAFDDEFRDTGCPHNTFLANDGQNNFQHHPDSYLKTPFQINQGVSLKTRQLGMTHTLLHRLDPTLTKEECSLCADDPVFGLAVHRDGVPHTASIHVINPSRESDGRPVDHLTINVNNHNGEMSALEMDLHIDALIEYVKQQFNTEDWEQMDENKNKKESQ